MGKQMTRSMHERLMELLEDLIHEEMEELHKLGREAKKMIVAEEDQERIDKKYVAMAKIVKKLLPAHDLIFDQNPKLEPLFESLMSVATIEWNTFVPKSVQGLDSIDIETAINDYRD